jgi:hypothetical protein
MVTSILLETIKQMELCLEKRQYLNAEMHLPAPLSTSSSSYTSWKKLLATKHPTRLIQALNLHLDTSRLGIRSRLERLDRILQLEAMRNQLTQIDNTALVQPNSLGPGIAVAVLELQIHLAGTQSHERNLHLVLADANDKDLAAKLDRLDSGADGALDTRAFHGVRGLDAVGQFEDGGLEVGGRVAEFDFVSEDVGDEGFGKVESPLVNVGYDERCCACGLTAEQRDEADGTGSAHDYRVAQAHVCAVHAGEGDGEGLQHGAVFKRHAVG